MKAVLSHQVTPQEPKEEGGTDSVGTPATLSTRALLHSSATTASSSLPWGLRASPFLPACATDGAPLLAPLSSATTCRTMRMAAPPRKGMFSQTTETTSAHRQEG